jgi:spermidine synthase
VWLHERLSREQSHALRSERLVLDKHTGIQRLELHRSRHFGKVLRLDGSFQTSENDEFFYHESLVHTAALVHEHPRTALLIGGGDGGALEELLKHPSMERVTLVELDRGVIEVAREHLRSIHKDAFDDPRVDVVIGDGHDHVLASPHRYDLILLDLPDPGAACERLYASSFFKACASRLTARGLLTLHLGPTTADMARLQRIHAALAASFAIVRPLRVTVPLYGSEWLLVVCSATPAADPAALSASEVEARLGRRGIPALQYLNGVVYQAALAMPNYLRHALALDAAP